MVVRTETGWNCCWAVGGWLLRADRIWKYIRISFKLAHFRALSIAPAEWWSHRNEIDTQRAKLTWSIPKTSLKMDCANSGITIVHIHTNPIQIKMVPKFTIIIGDICFLCMCVSVCVCWSICFDDFADPINFNVTLWIFGNLTIFVFSRFATRTKGIPIPRQKLLLEQPCARFGRQEIRLAGRAQFVPWILHGFGVAGRPGEEQFDLPFDSDQRRPVHLDLGPFVWLQGLRKSSRLGAKELEWMVLVIVTPKDRGN